MSLGLVIPVWNDQAALDRLLDLVQRLGLFEQVVVVDDHSDTAVVLPEMAGVDLHLIRNEVSQGPGPARNIGFERITTRHVLFFDSDDLLTHELTPLWHDLQDKDFDFCIFRHCDSRRIRLGQWGMTGYDATLWQAAGMAGRALKTLPPNAVPHLAQTANFPWNKIWRTAFLRAHNIQYSNTRVHEDIAPHWLGFLHARRILASDRVVALHHVAQGGDRLTNVQGPERLAVFDPLRDVIADLSKAPKDKASLVPAFVRFSCTLLDWIHGNLDARWHSELGARRRAFLQAAVPPPLFEQLLESDPALALHLTLQMAKDPALC